MIIIDLLAVIRPVKVGKYVYFSKALWEKLFVKPLNLKAFK